MSSQPECDANPQQPLSQDYLKERVGEYGRKLLSDSPASQREGSDELFSLIMSVWSLQAGQEARTSADFLCDEIRENGSLSRLLELCSSTDKDLQLSALRALEQVMVSGNRQFIADHKLFSSLVTVACSRGNLEMVQCGTGILENLFKVSTETCLRLIQDGALEGITFACRSTDPLTLQHCAAALANCAMYGEHSAQKAMVSQRYNADHWLFPLAFSNDNVVKYYALLAICFLAANKTLVEKVAQSSTLDLVLPFLNSQDPEEFAASTPNHAHGRSEGWLRRLVPLLSSESEEARSLAAFHFAMEAGIKMKQERSNIFNRIDAVEKLQDAAKQCSHLTANLCIQALTTLEERLPSYQCWNVLQWSPSQVNDWVQNVTPYPYNKSCPDFREAKVTGNMLVDIAMEDLLEIGFKHKLECKWFLERVRELRCLADVSLQDKDGVCKWLTGTSKDLSVYRVDFVRSGVTKALLPHLTEDILTEIGVCKRIDRMKVLIGLRELPDYIGHDTPDGAFARTFSLTPAHRDHYDVFVSYRRSTGSQLASLLKVHLHLRGIKVFLDVAELGSGKFDDAILTMISNSQNMILVLTPQCLDRCCGDARTQDWVHKELVCALDHNVHVVPVMTEEFSWPKEEDLPTDIQQVCKINGVKWAHEYQDACVEKLTKFLQLSPDARRRSMHSLSTK